MKIVVGLAAMTIVALSPVADFAPAAAAEESGTVAVGLAPGAAFNVQDINGDVSVRSGPVFAVRYRKHGSTDLVGVRVLSEQRSGETRVCVRYPTDDGSGCNGDYSSHSKSDVVVDFIITVPARTRVIANAVNGNVDVRTSGFVTAETVNGTLAVDAATADSLRTVNGELNATLHAPRAGGTLHAESVNGAVTIRMAAESAHVRAEALNGDIHAFGLPVSRPEYGPGAKVDGQFGRGGPSVVVKTVNGSIRVESI